MYKIIFPSNKWVIDVTNENAIHLYDDFYSKAYCIIHNF